MASPVRLWSLTRSSSGTDTVNYRELRRSDARNPPRRNAGAFRLVQVAPLLLDPPTIKVFEFPKIRFDHSSGVQADLKALRGTPHEYVAVSHVWDYGTEVDDQLRLMTIVDELDIDVTAEDGKSLDNKPISWRGLVQIAHAVNSNHLGALDYFWLDFLCLDQVDKGDNEMGLQICIMGDIYRAASSVLVMIGGIPSVQSTSTPTAWMDRAWTLQEAILNRNQWIFIKWSTNPAHQSILDPNSITGTSPKPVYWKFKQIPWTGPGVGPGEGLYVVKLRHLLDLADAQPLKSLPGLPTVAVLDGLTYNAGDAPRRALRACLSNNPQVRYTGVWRSMFMRTSSKPVDVVYSIMSIFGISIDPYRKNRPPVFLFNDLARKTAAKAKIGPVWLILSGVAGSEMPRDKHSRILPKFPHAEDANIKSNNAPPKMAFKKRWEWVGYHVDDTPFYIPRYDIKFLTHSHPHIINARMMEVKSHSRNGYISFWRSGVKASKSYTASIRLGSWKGKCTYVGKIPDKPPSRTVYGLYVGKVGDMTKKSATLSQSSIVEFSRHPRVRHFEGQHYLLFIKWDRSRKKWDCIADGVWKPNDRSWSPPKARYMLTIGAGSQRRHKRWPVPNSLRSTISPDNLDFRRRHFHHSYGFEPLPDFRHRPPSDQIIKWGYHKYDTPSGYLPSWSKRHIHYNIRGLVSSPDKLADRLKHPSALSVLSARSSNPPGETTEPTRIKITNDGHAVVPYSYDGWSRSACSKHSLNGVDGILLPKTGRNKGRQPYWVRIWFGDWVMYVQMKFHRNTPEEYWNMVVVPYRRRGIGGFVVNGDYIKDPVPERPYPYTPRSTSDPQTYPVYQPVVPIYLPTVIPVVLPIYYPIGFRC